MDEKKEIKTKKINIKNKKAATKALSKTTSKPKKTAPKKKPTTVKKTETKKEPVVKEIKETTEKKVNKREKEKKIEKKEKEKQKEKKVTSKKSSKKTTKKDEKTKLVLPKEWQGINKKQKEEVSTTPTSDKLTGRFKKSIFEEVDEKTFLMQKQKEKESLKKTFIAILIIASIIGIALFILFKYNENLRKQLMIYEVFSIGTEVQLSDESKWYVVVDSKEHEETVRLLKAEVLDINADSKIDDKDVKQYNSTNASSYDINDENSAANYLENVYRKELEEKVGKINEISLLTSKEFVKIREKMGFGYEWSDGNWLANSSLGEWWIISSPKENSVYTVTKTGSYRINSANKSKRVRPVIVIEKKYVTKVSEPVTAENAFVGIASNVLENKIK